MSEDANRQIYREEAYELLAELEETLLELEQAPDDADLTNRVFRALHTIKGSGAMFGFDDIADFTHEVETVFERVRSGDIPVTKPLISLVFQARDHIQNLLDASVTNAEVDVTPVGVILGGLHRLAAGESLEEPEEPEQPSEAPEAEAVKAEEAPKEPEPEAPPRREPREMPPGMRVRFSPRNPDALPPDYAPDMLLEEMAKLAPCRVLSGLDGEHPGWELVLTGPVTASSVGDLFFFSDVDMELELTPLDEEALEALLKTIPDEDEDQPGSGEPKRLGELLIESGVIDEEDLEEALAQQKPVGRILTDSGKVSEEEVRQAVERQSEQRKAQIEARAAARSEEEAARRSRAAPAHQESVTSLRVAADKLDNLVDLVGELVIVQARISQLVSERSDPQLTLVSEDLERLSDELRDSTLSIRMLPIGTTFAKYRRLVRDLSADLDKEIELSTRGGETELDKTVLERLGDPLVHLLRNSIDHGLETPEERLAQGKGRTGTILLSAEHSGGEVLIRIVDDGKGIDAEAIRAKALERGLIGPDAELSDRDLYQLIFEPGFSTARKVTSVSGRGVGMDVVKRAIDALRGTIDIDSKPGKGATITIRLPLTLAIIEGLQVQTGDEYFVIPLSLVEECVEHARQEDEKGGRSIMDLRGEIVPYVSLRHWFEINGPRPDIEQIVVTGVEGRRVGIVVDRVIGEHQTVIKSLGKVYKDVPGVSGATIKGDGSIALILDVPAFIRRVAVEVG